jgi:hypothetical protein
MTTTELLRSRMNRNDSRPVLKTSGVGDSLAEFTYTTRLWENLIAFPRILPH